MNQALKFCATWREPKTGSIRRLGFLKSSASLSLTVADPSHAPSDRTHAGSGCKSLISNNDAMASIKRAVAARHTARFIFYRLSDAQAFSSLPYPVIRALMPSVCITHHSEAAVLETTGF